MPPPSEIDDRTKYSGRTFYIVLAAAVGGAVWATTVNLRLDGIETALDSRNADRWTRPDMQSWATRLGDNNPTIYVPDIPPRQ